MRKVFTTVSAPPSTWPNELSELWTKTASPALRPRVWKPVMRSVWVIVGLGIGDVLL